MLFLYQETGRLPRVALGTARGAAALLEGKADGGLRSVSGARLEVPQVTGRCHR
jgi:hypothetical protein